MKFHAMRIAILPWMTSWAHTVAASIHGHDNFIDCVNVPVMSGWFAGSHDPLPILT